MRFSRVRDQSQQSIVIVDYRRRLSVVAVQWLLRFTRKCGPRHLRTSCAVSHGSTEFDYKSQPTTLSVFSTSGFIRFFTYRPIDTARILIHFRARGRVPVRTTLRAGGPAERFSYF